MIRACLYAFVFAVTLSAAPALANEGQDASSAGRQPAARAAARPVTDREVGQYVDALRAIARWQPDVAAALTQGDTMDRRVLDKTSWREKLRGHGVIREAGLTGGRFLEIAQQINQQAPLRQRYQEHLGPAERAIRP